MDIEKMALIRTIAQEQRKHAENYADARKKAGVAKVSLELLLTAGLPSIRKEKKNVGIEMAMMMLMEFDLEARKFYKEWQEQEAIYKGLEKLLEAHATRISFEQSVLKYIHTGEKYG